MSSNIAASHNHWGLMASGKEINIKATHTMEYSMAAESDSQQPSAEPSANAWKAVKGLRLTPVMRASASLPRWLAPGKIGAETAFAA